jgi:hypothetical protein
MPYRYKPVQRIVTVEFVNDPRRRKEYDVRITPEQVVVRDGDTIVWDVQGLTPAQANKVSFGKFDLIEPAARVTSGKNGLQQAKAKQLPGWGAAVQPPTKSVRAANRKYRATVHLDQAGLGFYKYDIMFDGRTIVDPDVEVRGPKR